MRWHSIPAIVVTNPPPPDILLKCPTWQNQIWYLLPCRKKVLDLSYLLQPISYNSARGGISQITERGDTTASFLLVQPARFCICICVFVLYLWKQNTREGKYNRIFPSRPARKVFSSQLTPMCILCFVFVFVFVYLYLCLCICETNPAPLTQLLPGLSTPASTAANQVLEISSRWRFMWYEVRPASVFSPCNIVCFAQISGMGTYELIGLFLKYFWYLVWYLLR